MLNRIINRNCTSSRFYLITQFPGREGKQREGEGRRRKEREEEGRRGKEKEGEGRRGNEREGEGRKKRAHFLHKS